jgi:hypothetical protein
LSVGRFQLSFGIKWPARGCNHRRPDTPKEYFEMPNDVTPISSAAGLPKCAVEGCPAPVALGRQDCCSGHTAEDEAATLATFVRNEVERRDGDVLEAIRATRSLLETLVMLAAYRGVLARLAAAG